MGMISFPILYFCSIIMMTLSCHIVNVKPKVKMKNEDVDVLWVCIDFLIFSYLQITPQYGSSMNSGSSSLDLVMVQYFKPSSSILVVVTSSAPTNTSQWGNLKVVFKCSRDERQHAKMQYDKRQHVKRQHSKRQKTTQ